MSINEEMELIAKAFQRDIDALNNLPEKEAQKKAHKNLVNVGIITEAGEFTKPYKALEERYV